MRNSFIKISLVIVATMMFIISIAHTASNIIIENETKNVLQTRAVRISLLSELVIHEISDPLNDLENSAKLNDVQNSNYANYISPTLHGIPENMDIEKRQIAKQILSSNHDLATVRFFMPNGDMYMQEPYSAQLKLKQLNYAFRDYFHGTVNAGKPYISEVFQAQSLDMKSSISIGVPVYSNTGSLIGIWSGLFDPSYLTQFFKGLPLENDSMIMIFDHNGKSFVDTNNEMMMKHDYADLTNYINLALTGKEGADTSIVNGIKTFIVYHPVVVGTHTWAVLLTQPYDGAFFVVKEITTLFDELVIASVIIVVASISVTYVLLRSKIILNQIIRNKSLDLEKTRHQLSVLYDEDPDLLCTVDSKCIILKCNRTFASTLRYSKDDLIGKSGFDYVADKSMDAATASFSSFIENGSIRDSEIWLKKRNGDIFPCLISADGEFDESDRFIGLVTIKNMTIIYEAKERLLNEKLVKSQYDEISKIKHTLDEASLFSMTDKNGIIKNVNKKFCEVSGYSEKELIGQNHRLIKSGYHSPEFYANIWETISSGKTWKGDIKNITKQGDYYWVRSTIMPILDANGIPVEYLSIRTDITNQKKTEEELEKTLKTLQETQKQKEAFTSMISHELKTPIVPIKGYCEMFQNGMFGKITPEQIDAINEISDNSSRMEKLILNLLDLNKLELDKMILHKEVISSDVFIEKIFAKYYPIVTSRDIKFLKYTEKSMILTDPDKMKQIFENLIQNAMSFTPSGGTIEIGTKNTGVRTIFYVKDSGTGISKIKQENLFKPFYQAEKSSKRKHGGAGLGLSICKGLVETMGGRIWVESQEGQGTIFFFEIPPTEVIEIETHSNKSRSEEEK